MERWKGRVAVVTGASSGIGACIVERLLDAGMKVVALARRREILEKKAAQANARNPGSYHPFKCDLTKEEDILAVFAYVKDNFETLHVLVNCAGIVFGEKIIEGNTANMRKILDVNVLAVAICAREASKLMREHKVRGHIINVNSIAGHEAPRILFPVSIYCASKYAVTGMTESLRNEFDSLKCGIKISSISPGAVDTEMIRSVGVNTEMLQKKIILNPEDVADAVLFALSTPPHVQIRELMITPLDDAVQNAK